MDSIPVLLVEDEALILTLAEDTLKEAGYAVSTASHGREAMRMLDSQNAAFRALVTDIDLHDPVTGWDLARHAREKDPEIAIVFVTGGGTSEWPSRGVPNSVLITKPFAPAQLVTAVSQLLNQAPPTPG